MMIANNKPLVSIAMATYNGGKYIKEQLFSILDSDYENLEIIIVDDASSDNTLAIINNFMTVDNRIKLYTSNENKGALYAFERALTLSTGDFIALSDQDDIWDKNKITCMLEVFAIIQN